jgi:hypothetical protein
MLPLVFVVEGHRGSMESVDDIILLTFVPITYTLGSIVSFHYLLKEISCIHLDITCRHAACANVYLIETCVFFATQFK